MKSKNKGEHISFIIMLVILAILIPLVAKCGNDLINSKLDITVFGEGYFKSIISFNTFKEFLRFNNPLNVMGMAVVLFYVISYILNKTGTSKDLAEYEQLEKYGSHGTSKWKTKAEIKDLYYGNDVGWFLGGLKPNESYNIGMDAAYHTVENRQKLNMQCIVVGPPGSQKTTGFVLPNIFNIPQAYMKRNEEIKNRKTNKFLDMLRKRKDSGVEMPDLIITDPKPELYPLTANELEKYGYDIFVLDFVTLSRGDSLNSFDFIDDDKTLMEIAQGYIDSVESAQGGKASGDSAFWNSQEAQVLAALMGFIKQKKPKNKQNFTEVTKILTSSDVSDIDSARYFFEENNITGAALQLWNNFLMLADSERTRANILGGLAEKLKLFAIDGIQKITNKTTIDISKLGLKKEKPMAVFIFMPVQDRTFRPIINVTINTMFKQLYKTSFRCGSKLEVPVYCILEEMANIGKIDNMQEMLGTMRGARIYPMMIWQSLAQMKDRYKEGYDDIISQCDTQIYLGINDMFTAKRCSETLGNTTIKVQATGEQKNGFYSPNSKSQNFNYQSRSLLMPDECMRFDNDKLILWQRSQGQSKLYKVQYKYWENLICARKKIEDLPKLDGLNNMEDRRITNDTIEMNNIDNKDIENDLSLEGLRSMMYGNDEN